MFFSSELFVLLTLGLSQVGAHPGHDVAEEAAERAEFFRSKPRTLRHCAAQLEQRGLSASNIKRRQDLAHNLRVKRGLTNKSMVHRRAFSTYSFSHYSNESYTIGTDRTSIFADNSSCTLQTEVTQGPYYVDGELVRQDVTDDEPGVPLYLDVQIVDTSNCEPVSNVYMDLWHANSTGVYSGVVAAGNGDSNDASNVNNNALRGIQQTDQDGTVQFHTVFPGHYSGRATHIHIMTHNVDSTTELTNDTILSTDAGVTHASHVGQLFFDQSLIAQVDLISPYSTNDAVITPNSEDSILAQEADTTDPFVEYVLLGDTLADGILAWISIGINPSSNQEIDSASTYYASGGVANQNSIGGGSAGGPDGSPGGNGTGFGGSGPPSGAPGLGAGGPAFGTATSVGQSTSSHTSTTSRASSTSTHTSSTSTRTSTTSTRTSSTSTHISSTRTSTSSHTSTVAAVNTSTHTSVSTQASTSTSNHTSSTTIHSSSHTSTTATTSSGTHISTTTSTSTSTHTSGVTIASANSQTTSSRTSSVHISTPSTSINTSTGTKSTTTTKGVTATSSSKLTTTSSIKSATTSSTRTTTQSVTPSMRPGIFGGIFGGIFSGRGGGGGGNNPSSGNGNGNSNNNNINHNNPFQGNGVYRPPQNRGPNNH